MPAESRSVEHVGEWKLSIEADNLEDLFAEVARVIAREAGVTQPPVGEWEQVTLSARDLPTLLADWANELLGRSESEGRAYGDSRDVQVIASPDERAEISAEVRGARVTRWTSSLKAATYHGLSLKEQRGRWHAEILFDV